MPPVLQRILDSLNMETLRVPPGSTPVTQMSHNRLGSEVVIEIGLVGSPVLNVCPFESTRAPIPGGLGSLLGTTTWSPHFGAKSKPAEIMIDIGSSFGKRIETLPLLLVQHTRSRHERFRHFPVSRRAQSVAYGK